MPDSDPPLSWDAACERSASNGPAPRSEEGIEIRAAGVRLELGHCCHNDLSWECVFERKADAGRVAQALAPLGYTVSVDRGFVLEVTHAEGQTLVVVPRTGRVQLRLPYTTAASERRALARKLATEIGAAVSAAQLTNPA